LSAPLGIILSPFSRNKKLHTTLTAILGFSPKRIRLYEIAFTHKSASIIMSDGEMVNNERLEYLGDAILDAIVAEHLFKQFPNEDEGFLTKMKSRLVKRKNLNLLASRLGLDQLIKSHTNPDNHIKHVYGNAFEALIGAIYLDKGYKKTRKFIIRLIKKYVDIEKLKNTESNYKSMLIEWAQKNKKEVIFDSKRDDSSEQHMPLFTADVYVMSKVMGKGTGHSKKEADQKAAKDALDKLNA